MNDICPYCGNRAFKTHIHSFELIGSENDLIIFNGTSLGSRVIYECQNCGLLFTQEQIDWEMKLQRAKASAKDTGRPCLRREEDVLKGARKLMADKQWYFARDVLDKFCYPYEHPLEFMIYRCICTVWSRFNNNEDNLLERWESLTVLRYNLKRACDLLPRDDEDKLYQANLSIQQALETLDISSYEYVQNKNWKVVLCETGYILTDRTKAAIAEIMCTYAEHLELEAFAHDRHSLDYLKLAVKTWNNCLKNAANSRLSSSELETLAIPVANCQGFVVPLLAFASCRITRFSLSFTV